MPRGLGVAGSVEHDSEKRAPSEEGCIFGLHEAPIPETRDALDGGEHEELEVGERGDERDGDPRRTYDGVHGTSVCPSRAAVLNADAATNEGGCPSILRVVLLKWA